MECVSEAIALLVGTYRVKKESIVTQGENYEKSVSLWNALVSTRPAIVILCETVEDIRSGIITAATCHLSLAVRGGGHDPSGRALRGKLVLDVTRLNTVTHHGEVLIVGGGAQNLDVATVAASINRLAVTGIVGTVGFAGLATGGGYGHATAKYGMACDSILGAEIVTANGEILHVDSNHHPDLLWAIRGGGGNFGVVASLTIRTYPQEELSYGVLSFPWDQVGRVCEAYSSYEWPEEATVSPTFFGSPDGQLSLRLSFAFCGESDQATAIFEQVKAFGRPSSALLRRQTMRDILIDTEKRLMTGVRWIVRTVTLDRLSPEAVTEIMYAMETRSSPLSWIGAHPLHGYPTHIPIESTAFGYRRRHLMFGIYTAWKHDNHTPHRKWADSTEQRLQPFAVPYAYPNYFATDRPEQSKHAYGTNKERLLGVKRMYDPLNVFKAITLPDPIDNLWP